MTDFPLIEMGAGGALAVIIIREVLQIVLKSRNGEYISRKEFDKHKSSVQYKDNCNEIVKRLDEANQAQEKRFDSIDRQFGEVKQLIKNGGK